MTRRARIALALATALALHRPGLARAGGAGSAGCTNPNLPVTLGPDPIATGVLTLSLSTSWTRVGLTHPAVDDALGQGPIDVTHDEVLWLGETRVSGALGLTPGLELVATLPVRVITTRTTYTDAQGEPVVLAAPDIHHRDETISGLADPWLIARLARRDAGLSLELRAGLTLPLGSTVTDPFARGDAGLPHQHIQLGFGTVTPLVGFEVARTAGPVRASIWGLTQQVVLENGHGWKSGDRYGSGVEVGVRSRTGLALRGGVEVQVETAERWHGKVPHEDGNQGRVELLAGVGVGVALTPALWLDLSAKGILARQVVGADVSQPLIATLAIAWRLPVTSSARAREAHAAELAAEAAAERALAHAAVEVPAGDVSWDGADLAVLAPPGTAPALAPVAGKLTVIDVWARWCAPCRELDRRLAPLARAHAGRLAIRKLDVIDWDSAAAARYLAPGGFGLPHVKVLSPTGDLLFEGSGDPALLAKKIEELLDTASPAAR